MNVQRVVGEILSTGLLFLAKNKNIYDGFNCKKAAIQCGNTHSEIVANSLTEITRLLQITI